MALDRELVSLLACPKCKGHLEERPDGFACHACRLFFALEEGIPNFLLSDARPLGDVGPAGP